MERKSARRKVTVANVTCGGRYCVHGLKREATTLVINKKNRMKNFKNLGKILSKTELTKVKGGYIDPGGDAILCKATTTKCKVYNLNGTYQDGTCDTAPASGPRLSYCGCKVGTEIQEATECKP